MGRIFIRKIHLTYTMILDPAGDTHSGDTCDDVEKILKDIVENKERLNLLHGLNKRGLCTRDILSFIVNQTELRSVNKHLDKSTAKRAMKSKIEDCKAALRVKQVMLVQCILGTCF